ncbi:protein FAM177B isoform X2 [Microcaecilia unicolor]|uniref:Protein FAM177B isoform X2 n=1 Tax=Microcaecilia unicolor TaxID=1415580 RepID=A0A6P7XN61_9AMPH|nr:protein FAM177B isoform X2 [Microcaecilia unicolor]
MEDTGEVVQNKLEEVDLGKQRRPKRIINFVSGETMEEYSTEDEEEDDKQKEIQNVDTSTLSWGSYLQFWLMRIATSSFFTCDFLGGKLASLLGLNLPKYQYAIDEHYRTENEGSNDEDEDEDGGVVATSHEAAALREKQHFPMQSVAYGSISSPKNTISLAEKTTEYGLGNLSFSTRNVE